MSNRKKARLQTEADADADADASNMEIDEDVAPEWKHFLESGDFDPTIVHDIVEEYDFVKDALRQGSREQLKGGLVTSLCRRYPGFTLQHAGTALDILEPDLAESTHFSHRGPDITDGLDTVLVHDLDLKAFEKRIEQLFEWHDQVSVREEFLAPYFALVQSSGMGKTKLFIEFRKLYNGRGQNYVCKTILCLDANLNEQDREKFYDYMLIVDETDAKSIVDAVWAKMDDVVADVKERTEKIVLLFDEAQGLMKGIDPFGKKSLVFRAIRWWLRVKRDKDVANIVAAFAGTTVALSNFFPPDPPKLGASRKSKFSYANYEQGDADIKKLYPPFYELNTIACLRQQKPLDKAADPGFPHSAIYGRPMFAHYHLEETLDARKMGEFAKRLVLSRTNYEEHLSSCYSVLGSRVQMGIVNSFHTLSTLISSGYACLVDFRQQDDIKSTPVALVSFMPDPVCATLAMRFMNKNWQDGELKGKERRFWVEQAEKAFTTKLCLPDKGDAGEIFAALYMLFCGDMLRQDTAAPFSTFVVPLDDWFALLKNCGKEQIVEEEQTNEEGLVSKTAAFLTMVRITRARAKRDKQIELMGETTSTVSFVQVCRNDFRSHSFCEAETLEYMYRAGLGSYAFKNCRAFNIYASIRVVGKSESQVSYHPLLVSVKNWARATKGDVQGWMSTMMSFLDELRPGEDPSAVCLIILLGCSNAPNMTGDMAGDGLNSQSLKPFPAVDVFRLVHVHEDEFGVSDAIQNLGAGSELSEIYSSHAFMACENSADNLLRTSSVNQERVNKLFEALKLSTEDKDTGGKPEHSHG